MKRWRPKLNIIMTIIHFTITLIITMTWLCISCNNPIRLSLIIFIIAIYSSIIFSMLLSSWYAIILFLIYIGGIIVIFSYFVRFSSNDSIWLKRKLQSIIIPFIIIKNIKIPVLLPRNPSTQILKLYLSSNILIMILITLVLLLIILIIVKIVKIESAPLRSINIS